MYHDTRLSTSAAAVAVIPVDPDDVADRAILRSARRLGAVLASLVGALVLAGGLIPMGAAVQGGGRLVVGSRVKTLAHPTGGVVAALYVRDGASVVAGQPLLRLDTTVSAADAALSSLSLDQMLAERARLEAERLGTGAVAFGSDLTARSDASADKAMTDARALFALRRQEQSAEHAQLSDRIRQYGAQIVGFRHQISANRAQQALIAPERNGLETLYQRGLVTISRRNQLARTQVEFDGSNGALEAQIAQTEARITEARSQMIQLAQARRSEAATQLAALNTRINEQRLRRVSADDLRDRAVLRASGPGVVNKLAVAAIGDVVKPAEPLLEIVPGTDGFEVEANIEPGDIDQVAVGGNVQVRLSALNAASTPEMAGRIIFVAAERSVDPQTQRSFYVVRVRLLGKPRDARLVSGMPAEIFIVTGNRSLFGYLAKPLLDQLARAMRDNG